MKYITEHEQNVPYFLKLSDSDTIKKWWNKMLNLPKSHAIMKPVVEEIKKIGKWDYVNGIVNANEIDIDNASGMTSMGFYDD